MIKQRNQEERRIIIKANVSSGLSTRLEYIVLKPLRFSDNGDWESKGRIYWSVRQLYNFIKGDNYCIFDPRYRSEIIEELKNEIRRVEERKQTYKQRFKIKER